MARRTIPYLVTAMVGFLVAYAFVAVFVFPAKLIPTDSRVPNIVGLAFEEAATRLADAGFVAASGESRYHASAPSGTVLGQNPVPGSVEPARTEITLDVSLGQRTGEVPSVTGLTRSQAELAIENAGFDVSEVTEQESSAPRGQVLGSRPTVGTRVPVPSPIDLIVSAGPSTVQVPDVVGQNYSRARNLLTQVGLIVGHVTIDSLSMSPPDLVVAQTPAGNRTVAAGTAVSLIVSGRSP